MEDMASLTAQAFFQHDVGHRMGISLASFTCKQDLLGLVQIQVTALTRSDGLNLLDYFVLDIQVTLVALDFMGVDMGIMHKVGIIIFFQPFCFHVAFEAVFSWDLAIAMDGKTVAFVAFEAAVKDDGMVVSGGFLRNKILPAVAMGAFADLWIMLAFLEVTDETGAVGNGDVLSLDDLRMTAGAAKLLAPPQVGEMDFMVEDDFIELHLAFQKSFIMAAFPEAGFVRDLGPRFGFQVEFGPISSDLKDSLNLCSQF